MSSPLLAAPQAHVFQVSPSAPLMARVRLLRSDSPPYPLSLIFCLLVLVRDTYGPTLRYLFFENGISGIRLQNGGRFRFCRRSFESEKKGEALIWIEKAAKQPWSLISAPFYHVFLAGAVSGWEPQAHVGYGPGRRLRYRKAFAHRGLRCVRRSCDQDFSG